MKRVTELLDRPSIPVEIVEIGNRYLYLGGRPSVEPARGCRCFGLGLDTAPFLNRGAAALNREVRVGSADVALVQALPTVLDDGLIAIPDNVRRAPECRRRAERRARDALAAE